jgi:hypothetical protein
MERPVSFQVMVEQVLAPPGHSCLGFARGVVDPRSPKNKHNLVSLHVQLMWKIDVGGGRRPKVHRALFNIILGPTSYDSMFNFGYSVERTLSMAFAAERNCREKDWRKILPTFKSM